MRRKRTVPIPDRRGKLDGPAADVARDWILAAAMVAAVFLVYQPAWHGGFVWDDNGHVTRPELRSWQGLWRIWFDLGATQQYYPFLHSAFWIEHKLWDGVPLGYHLLNILLHATAALLAALILRRLDVPGAYLAAAIFALHPVHVESVAWITEQKNTLSAVFYLGAMLVYLRFDRTRQAWAYLAALGLFVLGLLSKTVTATLPGALLVVFWWQRGRLSWRRDVLPLVPYFTLGAAAGLLTAWVERKLIGAEGAAFELGILERGLLAGRVIWFYLGKLVWPCNLLFIYPRWTVSGTVWWQYLFPAAAALLLVVLWGLRRRWRSPLAALLYFIGTLVPVLGFCNVYPFLFSFVADHFQYLASLGIISLASGGVAAVLGRWGLWGRAPAYGVCGLLLLALAALTWRQSRMYADDETLLAAAAAGNPNCWMARNNLGMVLANRGRFEEAITRYHEALAIRPDYAEAHNNLGNALRACRRIDEAIAEYQRALKIKAAFPEAHNNLGIVLGSRGQVDEAIRHYLAALEIKPDYAQVDCNFADLLASQGREDEAIDRYQTALEINPEYAEAHVNLGTVLAGRGRVDDAIVHFIKALELRPDLAEVHYNLGHALWDQGRLAEATDHYRAAAELRPYYVAAHCSLGNLLVLQGQSDAAAQQYLLALRLDPGNVLCRVELGRIRRQQGHLAEAEVHLREAHRMAPSDADVCFELGRALQGQGKIAEAISWYEQSLKIHPDQPAVLVKLAWIRAAHPDSQLRDGAEAVRAAERAVKLLPDCFQVLDVLAAAYAEGGRFGEAAGTAEKALALAVQARQPEAAEAIRVRRASYLAGRPFRAAPGALAASSPRADIDRSSSRRQR